MTGTDFGAIAEPGRAVPARRPRACCPASTCWRATASPCSRAGRSGLVTNHTGLSVAGASTIDVLHQAPGRHAGVALQPRARHPRAARRRERAVVDRRAHRPADPLALRRHAAADRRDARRASTRWSSTCRTSARASTPISPRWATCWKKPRSTRSRWSCSTGRTRSTAGTWKGRSPADDLLSFIAYMPMPIRHGMTIGELAQLFNAERKIGADLTVVHDGRLAARSVVRPDRTHLGESVAEHAQPHPGDALPGHRRHRVRQHLGRPRHRPAVRADRRAVDRRAASGGRAQRAPARRHPLLSGALHAVVERARTGRPARACSSW